MHREHGGRVEPVRDRESEQVLEVLRGRRGQAFGKFDPPGKIGWPAIVVVHQEAADPTQA